MYPIAKSMNDWEDRYFFKACKNDTHHLRIPITNLSNFAVGFNSETNNGFLISGAMSVAVYDASALPTITTPIYYPVGVFFTEVIAFEAPDGVRHFYGRGINPAVTMPCNFYIGIVSASLQIVYTYNDFALKNVTVGGVACNCFDGESHTIESSFGGFGELHYSQRDCCGLTHWLPSPNGSSSTIFLSSTPYPSKISNKIEIAGKLVINPPKVKRDLFEASCSPKITSTQRSISLKCGEVDPIFAEKISCILAGKNIVVDGAKTYVSTGGNVFDTLNVDCMCNFSQNITLEECPCTTKYTCGIPKMCKDENGGLSNSVATLADGSTRDVPMLGNFYYLLNNPIVSISPSYNQFAATFFGTTPPIPQHTNDCQRFVELLKADTVTLLPCTASVIVRYYVNGVQVVVTLPANGSITNYYSLSDAITFPSGVFPSGSWITIGATNFAITSSSFFANVGNCFAFIRIV